MEQRDFLLQQAEQLGKVLGSMLSKLTELKDNKTLSYETANQVFKDEFFFDIDQIVAFDEDSWVDMLKNEKHFDLVTLEKLADILFFTARYTYMEESENDRLFKKNLILYKYVEQESKYFSFDRKCNRERTEAYLGIRFLL